MTLPNHPYKPAADLSKFYVITPISNPRRYARRYELYHQFAAMVRGAGVNLITVEQAFGSRPFMVTQPDNHMDIQVRSVEELWIKENLCNIGIRRAKELGATMVAWIDADVRYAGDPYEWFSETYHALQHYEIVQMCSNLIDLNLNNEPIGGPQKTFMANYVKLGSPDAKKLKSMSISSAYKYAGATLREGTELFIGHPGAAWASNMDAIEKLGGLIDYAILGSSDHFMAYSLLGTISASRLGVSTINTSAYEKRLLAWQDRAEHWIKRDVGYVNGTLLHYFHGQKKNRGYSSRWKILTDNKYDPDTDIKYDAYGQLQLETVTPRQIKLRDQIRAYFASRMEDDTEGGYN